MRIMHMAGGGDVGGAKTHILSLGQQLARHNDFHLVSLRPGAFAEEARAAGLSVTVTAHPWNILALLQDVLRVVDEFRPDVIHCHGTKANMMGVMVKLRRHIPVITTVHSDPALDYMGQPLKQLLFGGINGWALRHMDFYMSVASRMERTLIERGVDPQKIYIIYNGLDFSTATAAPRRIDAAGDIVVGIAARLTPIKNIPTLLRAFAKAYARNPRLRLKIAGSGEDEHELKALAQKLKIADRVDFVGWVTDMRDFFSGVDINVLSSFSETFPYSLLEGALEHCAAVASNVGGVPELIRDGETGFLFAPQDEETFAGDLYRLSVDDALRERLADNLFRRASEEFSLAHMCEVQEAAYRSVVQRAARRQTRQGAVICGAYGRGNAGDEAILQAIVAQMRSIDPDMPLTVLSRNKTETRLRNKTDAIYVFDVLRMLKKLSGAQLYINGGGSLIQDVTSSRSLYFYLFTLWAARRCGCRVLMYGCGIGPINGAQNRRIAARVLNSSVDVITLRDSISRSVLASMRVDRPTVQLSADPTVTLSQAPPARVAELFAAAGVPADTPRISFCLRSWPRFQHYDYIAAAADYAYQRYGLLPVFIPIEVPRDVAAAALVTAHMQAPYYSLTQRYSVEELIGLLGSMQAVVGMRLHSLIFSSSGGAPVIGLSYDIKVDSFMRDIGSDACLGVAELTPERLCAEIDALAAGGFARSQQAMERLREGERINMEAARQLLEVPA